MKIDRRAVFGFTGTWRRKRRAPSKTSGDFDFSATSSAPFFIVDEAGEHVVIHPAKAITSLKGTIVNDHPNVNDDNAELGAFLRSHGMVPTMYMGIAGEHRFYEALLLPNDRLAAWGWVSEDTEHLAPQRGAGYRESEQRSLKRISGRPNYRAVLMLP